MFVRSYTYHNRITCQTLNFLSISDCACLITLERDYFEHVRDEAKIDTRCALFALALVGISTYLSFIGRRFASRTTLRKGDFYGECSNFWGLAFCPD